MGNIEAHDFAPVRPDERKELNLSRRPTYKQYLKHLEGEVHEACLRELPYALRDSISLYEIMKAAFNALTELPPELPLRLPHLRYLDLSHNQLEKLPCSFGLLFHLQTLILHHNKLRALPDTFTRLVKLEKWFAARSTVPLTLHHNKLRALPDTFTSLVKLEKIDLSSNSLRELPPDLGEMERVRSLSVAHNKLKRLPLSLGASPARLALLLADHNRLDSPPQAVCDEGSASTLAYLRKQFQAQQELSPPRPVTPLNEFPRQRSNQLGGRTVNNPHSAHVQYIAEQTHTTNTPAKIKTPLMPPLGSSSFDALELRDRILGLIYGAALGDVVGLTTRWLTADQCCFHYDDGSGLDITDSLQDRHRIPWRQGDWTSNFDILMLVMDSLLSWAGVVDELDFAKRLSQWSRHGFQELGDTSGVLTSSTITQVVAEKQFCTAPHSAASAVLRYHTAAENGSVYSDAETESLRSSSSQTSLDSAASGPIRVQELSSCSEFGTDNGAVIRCAVLGIPNFHDLHEVQDNSVRICRATHADPRCVASCVFVSVLVASLLQGRPHTTETETESCGMEGVLTTAREKALALLSDPRHIEHFERSLQVESLAGLKARERDEMSHTFKPVMAAVLALRWKGSFRSFLTELSMEGGDSNSNGCVGGAVLGLRTGYKRLPAQWLQGLRSKQVVWLNLRLNHLLDMMGLP